MMLKSIIWTITFLLSWIFPSILLGQYATNAPGYVDPVASSYESMSPDDWGTSTPPVMTPQYGIQSRVPAFVQVAPVRNVSPQYVRQFVEPIGRQLVYRPQVVRAYSSSRPNLSGTNFSAYPGSVPPYPVLVRPSDPNGGANRLVPEAIVQTRSMQSILNRGVPSVQANVRSSR